MKLTRREFFAATAFEWLLPWTWFRRDPQIAGVRFREVRHGDRRRYLWVHGNEKTAEQVLSSWMTSGADGRALFTLSDERNVPILGGQIDPNRMWSRIGAERNLKTLNTGWTPQQITRALDELDDDREKFLRRLLPSSGNLLIALHNNGPGYSVQDEVPISDAVSLERARPSRRVHALYRACGLRDSVRRTVQRRPAAARSEGGRWVALASLRRAWNSLRKHRGRARK